MHMHILFSNSLLWGSRVHLLPRESYWVATALVIGVYFFWPSLSVALAEGTSGAAPAPSQTTQVQPMINRTSVNYFYIQEFRVDGGGNLLSQSEIGEAVYPYLGPYRSEDDIRQACAAVEKMYRDKGYVFVSVDYGPQKTKI